MKSLIVLVFVLTFAVPAFSQNAAKDWTPWADVVGDWIQFQAVVEFYGGAKSPEQLVKAKAKPESLKVKTLIGGLLKRRLPQEVDGVRTIRVLYSAYGKFESSAGFFEDWVEVTNRNEDQNINPVTIVRPASSFDIAEAQRPPTEVGVHTPVPGIVVQLGNGVGDLNRTISGRPYRVFAEWRRKGKTVEVRLKDYRTK